MGSLKKSTHAAVAALVAVAALATVAACGGGDGASTTPSTSAQPKASTSAVTSAASPKTAATAAAKITIPAGAPQIDQVNQIFKPSTLTVKAGETVYFLNNDNAIHSVNVEGKNLMGQGGQMKQGAVLTWKAPAPGSYRLSCDYHPVMAATITVQ